MKRLNLILILFSALAFTACKNEQQQEEADSMETDMTEETMTEEVKKVTVELKPTSGSNLSGNVVFTEEQGAVTMVAVVNGISQGTHAIHLHENADCSAEDATSAGGHWNPTKEKHGKWGESEGHHRGDIGNLTIDENGVGTITMTTDKWCIGCDDSSKNVIGTAVIVHEGADDFTSQPSGDAGKRVGCGEVKM